jgi:hypothetical protein
LKTEQQETKTTKTNIEEVKDSKRETTSLSGAARRRGPEG